MTTMHRRLTCLAAALLILLCAAPVEAARAPLFDMHDPGGGTPSGTVRLMAVGDVMLAQTIGRRIKQIGPGAQAPVALGKPLCQHHG